MIYMYSNIQSKSTVHYDVIDFNEQHPDLTNFNIQPCFPADHQRHIIIGFNRKLLSFILGNVKNVKCMDYHIDS